MLNQNKLYTIYVNDKEYSPAYRNTSRELVKTFSKYIKNLPHNRNKKVKVKLLNKNNNSLTFFNIKESKKILFNNI